MAEQQALDLGSIAQLIALIRALLGSIGGGGGTTPPVVPPTIPPITPPPDWPDDPIKPPVTSRTVKRVEIKLGRVQLSRERFPEEYTASNPFGLVSPKPIQNGDEAMPYASKFWLDLTAYDQNNIEFLKQAILANDLEFKTEHHAGEAYIIGHGGTGDKEPNDGYETNDTDEIGNGITAWTSTNGFLHQMKAFGEGSFECWGKVGGVESNHFTIRVS